MVNVEITQEVRVKSKSQGVIPNHIKALRKSRGLTQQNIADSLGVTKAAVSYWESLVQSPPDATKIKLCRILGCTITDLFDWEA